MLITEKKYTTIKKPFVERLLSFKILVELLS